MRSSARTQNMPEKDYIAFEERSTFRHEMVNGKLYKMAGASRKHNLICQTIIVILLRLLQGKRFLAFQENMKVQISKNKDYAYPDIVVTFDEDDITSTENEYIFRKLTIIFEVLSPSTRTYDRTDKFIQYRKIESLKYYIMVDSEKIFVECTSKNEKDEWISEIYTQKNESIKLEEINVEIKLSDIYNS